MSSWKGKCNRAEKELKRAFDEWSTDKAKVESLNKEKEQLLHQTFELRNQITSIRDIGQRNLFERADLNALLGQKDIMI